LLGFVVSRFDLSVVGPVVALPAAKTFVAAAFVAMGAAFFVVGGGTRIVRGVLDKVQALPLRAEAHLDSAGDTTALSAPVDEPEYNRGKTIGNIERLLMLLVVGAGSYEALGFLVAAKGLIRAKELEERDYAEYFIVGNLASVLVAVIVALIAKAIITNLTGPIPL
jgi:hypothetical protein